MRAFGMLYATCLVYLLMRLTWLLYISHVRERWRTFPVSPLRETLREQTLLPCRAACVARPTERRRAWRGAAGWATLGGVGGRYHVFIRLPTCPTFSLPSPLSLLRACLPVCAASSPDPCSGTGASVNSHFYLCWQARDLTLSTCRMPGFCGLLRCTASCVSYCLLRSPASLNTLPRLPALERFTIAVCAYAAARTSIHALRTLIPPACPGCRGCCATAPALAPRTPGCAYSSYVAAFRAPAAGVPPALDDADVARSLYAAMNALRRGL